VVFKIPCCSTATAKSVALLKILCKLQSIKKNFSKCKDLRVSLPAAAARYLDSNPYLEVKYYINGGILLLPRHSLVILGWI